MLPGRTFSSSVENTYIDISLAKKFLKEAKELGTKELVIGGGSTELYPHLVELIEYASNLLYTSIEVSTNKPIYPIKKEVLWNLKKSGLKHIQIGLDSIYPLKLEKITG